MNKRTLPSQRLRLQKSQEIRKTLAVLCDDDDTDDSSGSAFVATRMAQKKNNTSCQIKRKSSPVLSKQLVEVESSSSDCSIISEKLATSHKQSELKNGRDTKSSNRKKQDSSSSEEETASKSTVRDKVASKQKHTIKSHVRIEKEVKNKINKRSCTESSESESDSEDNSTNKVSNARKSLPKSTVDQDKKKEIKSSDRKTKSRAKKNVESTSESEDEDVEHKKKQSTSKSRVNVQKDKESDDSSGKEFQKEKLQKVRRNQFSLKNSTDLEVDYTKTPVGSNTNNTNGEFCENLDDAKQIIIECKKMCSNFKMHIEALELQYKNKNDEQLILKSVEKMCKLKQIIDRKYTDLTNIYQSWKDPSAKKPQRKSTRGNLTESEESSKETNEERTAIKDKALIAINEQEENTNVSECDSDEIFSADEARLLQKKRVARNEMNTPSRTEDKPNGIDAETDSEDISLTYKDRDDETNAESRDAVVTSTALDTSKKNNVQSVEQSENVGNQNNKDCSANANTKSDNKSTKTPVTDTSNSEVEFSPLKGGVKSITLQNGKQGLANEEMHVFNTSADMFETSCEIAEDPEEVENITEAPERNDAETDRQDNKESPSETCNKESLPEINSSNKEAALPNEIPSEESKTSSSGIKKNVEDLSDKTTQPANEKTDNNSKNTDASNRKKVNNESLDDPEVLAKKNLLESDSDSLENAFSNTEMNIAPEDMIKDFIDQIRKEKETKRKNSEDDNSDTSTVILSLTKKQMSAAKEVDTGVTSQAERDNSPNNKSKESVSLDEDAKKEQAAKKELLTASTDESEIAESSCDSQEVIQKSELSSSAENIKAKKALLASNSDENSSVEQASETETRETSKKLKRTHEPDSDAESSSARTNKKRSKFEKSCYYKNNDDEKLRMSCEVHLERLSERVLKRYSRALQKSREYLEQKALKRYKNLSLKPLSVVLHRLK